jgi:hypothetical protein
LCLWLAVRGLDHYANRGAFVCFIMVEQCNDCTSRHQNSDENRSQCFMGTKEWAGMSKSGVGDEVGLRRD